MNKKIIGIIATLIIVFAVIFTTGIVGCWIFIGILTYCAVRLVCDIIRLYRSHIRTENVSGREFIVKITARFVGLFFIFGTIIYIFTFSLIGRVHSVDFNNTELIVRSMICSIKMFMLDADSNILDRLDDFPILKGAIVVQTVISFLCTLTLLAGLVYSRARAYYILHKKTKITSRKNHLYVFFGLNDNSRLLAKDITRNDDKAVIIFVDESTINDENTGSWDSIVNLFTHRQKTFDFAGDSNALVALASKQFRDIEEERILNRDLDLLSMIDLDKVKEFILSLNSFPGESELYIFFMSENEEENILNIMNLSHDVTIHEITENKEVKCKIYCHARYNGPNRVVEDLAVRKGINVEIIDSSHLAVELLKARKSDQPVRVAAISEEYPATVEAPIEALIVGFGEVGRDAFRFIYEFGTFISVEAGIRRVAKPKITAVDSRMGILNGAFEANTPGINYKGEDIRLCEVDCRSTEFYENYLSKEKCRKLNYIVIALGDDDQNISLAANIFCRIRRFRENMSDVIIMVRCIREEKREMMQKVADHYNKGCETEDLKVLRLFGNPQEIYSFDTIVNDYLTKRGKRFMKNYLELRCSSGSWEKRREELMELNEREIGKDYYPKLDKLRKLRRQESQDLANAHHVSTKMWLLHKSLGEKYDWKDFLNRYFDSSGLPVMTGKLSDISFPNLTGKENEIILSLAMLEHARWNAAHELLGYERNDDNAKCDERTHKHNCLKDWEELDRESERASSPEWFCDYKSYDFSVVNTSIALSEEDEDV